MGRSVKGKISFNTCKKKIATVWLSFSAVIFILFVAWTLGSSKFDDKASEAWNWLLPTIMPTLSLIIGILVVDLNSSSDSERMVDGFIYRIALGLSLFYLTLIFTILIFSGTFPDALFDVFAKSNLFLAPLQGLTSASIGAFYYKNNR